MPASQAKNLSSLFSSAIKTKAKAKPKPKIKDLVSASSALASASPLIYTPVVKDRTLKHFVSSLDSPPPAPAPDTAIFSAADETLDLVSDDSPSWLPEEDSPQESEADFILHGSNVAPESDSGMVVAHICLYMYLYIWKNESEN